MESVLVLVIWGNFYTILYLNIYHNEQAFDIPYVFLAIKQMFIFLLIYSGTDSLLKYEKCMQFTDSLLDVSLYWWCQMCCDTCSHIDKFRSCY